MASRSASYSDHMSGQEPDAGAVEMGEGYEAEGSTDDNEIEYKMPSLLSLQIKGLLDAEEDVDLDMEIAEDFVLAISQRKQPTQPSQGKTSPDDNQRDANGITVDEEESGDDDEDAGDWNDLADIDPETAFASLYARVTEGEEKAREEEEQLWTRQEIKQMKHHLKEKGMSQWIWEYVNHRGFDVPKLIRAFGVKLCPELQDRRPSTLLYVLKVALSNELRQRDRLPQYNTIQDAIHLIRKSERILILTGAGISVSCGIPDFRSRNGLYATLKDQGNYDIDDPQQMFDITYFKENPAVFYSFASQIYPSNFIPSPCHRFIKAIELEGKLLRNYTQNIDTLETLVGVDRALQCHGSFATASCVTCRRRVPGKELEYAIMNQKVPVCGVCNATAASATGRDGPGPGKVIIDGPSSNAAGRVGGSDKTNTGNGKKGKDKKKVGKKKARGEWDSSDEDESDAPEYPPWVMKPDITFFGEKLPDDFRNSLIEDRDKVDLLLVIGTSLKVAPVADILSHLPHSVPQILINKTPIRHINPDIVLLGDADEIIEHLVEQLGWKLPPPVPLSSPLASSPNGSQNTPAGKLSSALKRRLSGDQIQETGASGEVKQEVQYEPRSANLPRRVAASHVWLFEGAEGGQWLQDFERQWLLQHGNEANEPLQSPGILGQVGQHSEPQILAQAAKSAAISTPSSDSLTPSEAQEAGKRKTKRARMD